MGSIAGYAGKFLRVDMTSGRLSEERLDENDLRQYLGGTGFGTKVIYEEVPAGVEWSDPENRLVIASGPLAGTSVAGGGTFSVVAKGPLTNGATSTQANGFLGAYMKFAGFDGIIVQGQSDKWQYLYLHDGVAELRDASILVGKDTWETEDAIKAELGFNERAMSVFGIGPAGENLVKFAAIVGDKGHAAAHNGVGAVMGSKRLKAIAAARGKGSVAVTDRQRLSVLAKEMVESIKANKMWALNFYEGTLDGIIRLEKAGAIPIKNYTTNVYDISKEDLAKFGCDYIRTTFQARLHPCWSCPAHHCHLLRIVEGPYAGFVGEEPEYECFAAWGPLTGNTDVASAIVLANEVDRLGFDTNEAGYVIALTMECYEKGLITKKDTDGLEMTWGNVPAVRAMLRKMARREGLGDVLADGVMRAAQRIGGEAPNFGVHAMKGNAPRGHDHRMIWFEMFDTSLSDTGTIQSPRKADPEMFGLKPLTSDFAADELAVTVARLRGAALFEDCLGVCRFLARTQVGRLADMVKAATGWDYSGQEANRTGMKLANMLRVFNIRHGHHPGLDYPSPRYGSTPINGVAAGKSIMPEWDRMVDIYYREMGWDRKTGKPLPEMLRSLGLEGVVGEMWGQT